MNIAERYTTARHASNLKSDPRTRSSPADVLGAVGMAAQEEGTAVLLWSVVHEGNTRQKMRLVEALANDVQTYMERMKVCGDQRHITMEVLAWVMHGACPTCQGTRYEVLPDTHVRGDAFCSACGGTGKRPLPGSKVHAWLSDRIARLTSVASGRVMQKMSLQMDL